MSIQISTLSSGLRIITDPIDNVESVAIGIYAAVGTRHEDMPENGIAHMVEHMLFKGTPTRSAKDIVDIIEGAGGHMNAYTSREVTSYHIHCLKEQAPLALEILSDMVQNPTMPEDEISRERNVILQEIGMVNDSPDELVFDLFQENAFPGQALGAPILGRENIIRALSREQMMHYVQTHYAADNIVVSAAGNVCHDDIVLWAEKFFRNLPEKHSSGTTAARYKGGEMRIERKLEQAHIVLGFEGMGRDSKRVDAVRALSMVLGGGMSSRLFQEIREKRGLAYSVYSFQYPYADSGLFGIYAGTDPERLQELVPAITDVLRGLADTLADEEIVKAKTLMRSNFLMSRESMMTRADQQAKHLLHFGKALDVQKRLQKIEALDRHAIIQAANDIFVRPPTLTALGPVSALEPYDKIEKRLAA
ncbi:MAG: insulinase family protein [Alphaproteobacteria bacterium]|nr:insulinase family protein [Alphaproteobacteria bacterium]